MALNTSAFSQSQLDDIYKRNPTWAPNAQQQTAMPTAQQTAQPQTSTMPTTQATPNTASVNGGIDFSNIGPAWGMSVGNSTANSNSNSGLSQQGIQALTPLLGTGKGSMPSLIDDWASKAANSYQVSAQDIINTMNQVANQRAGHGIMGGTESQNLMANMLTNLMTPTLQNQANVYQNAMTAKAQTMPQLIGLTNQSGSTGGSTSNNMSYNTSPQDYQIIANLLNQQW